VARTAGAPSARYNHVMFAIGDALFVVTGTTAGSAGEMNDVLQLFSSLSSVFCLLCSVFPFACFFDRTVVWLQYYMTKDGSVYTRMFVASRLHLTVCVVSCCCCC
jgi:hypothetical protein